MTKILLPGSRQAGATLIEILFAVAILGIGSAIFLQYSKVTIANRAASELIRQRTLVTSMLINTTVCSKTPDCTGSELVDLKDLNERILVAADGSSRYGPFQVQAQCKPDKTIEVRAAIPLPKGGYRADPLTGKPMNLTSDSGIILNSGALCGTLDKGAPSGIISLLRSARCGVGQGTCAPPPESVGIDDTLKTMCCQDGSDIQKPSCGTGKELGAYWDREGNWGAEGSWVVFCE